MRSAISILSALSAISLLGVSAQDDMPADLACVDQCNNSNRNEFASLGCTSAEDRACLCALDNFQYSVRDCAAQSCPGTTEDQVQNWLGANFCAGFMEETPEESAATTTAEAPSDTTTEAAPEETTAPAETTEAAPTTTELVVEETTSAVAETTPTPESTPASSTVAETPEASEASETESAAATSTADENEEDDEEAAAAAGGGLSQGAAVGIGVGVAVVVVAIAVVAIVLLMKKRKNNKQQQGRGGGNFGHDNISRPIQDPHAGIGRAYGGSDDFGEKRGESIEMTMTGHRYEDMVPRQTPRTMV